MRFRRGRWEPRAQTELRNTAVELKGKNLPVILCRVASTGVLKSDEKKAQTLSSSVHASVGGTEVWPLQKTAAWIQGAMQARVSFVLLNDPRADDILIGGIDKPRTRSMCANCIRSPA